MAPAITKPPLKSPVALRTTPIMQGPKNPPRLPKELINAIPAAAAVPLNNAVDVAQNGPIMENADSSARLRNTIWGKVEVANAAHHKPIAPPNADKAKCQRRSPVPSECIPTRTMATAVAMYGMVESRPIPKLPALETLWIKFGSHKLKP